MDDGSRILATAELTRHALDYAARGWPVFMLGAGKVPLRLCRPCREADGDHDMEACPCLTCHGFYAASTDPERVVAMVTGHPRGVLALRTGASSGVVVVDVDPRNDGTHTFVRLLADGVLPATVTANTGSRGLHLYYAHPGGTVKSGGNRLGPGVDVKADGAYVVLPPSTVNGKAYTWRPGTDPTSLELSPIGHKLAELLAPAEPSAPVFRPAPMVSASASAFAAPSNARGRLAGLVSVVLSAPEGNRNDVLNWAAYKAADVIMTGAAPAEAVVAALADAAAHIGLAPAETRGTIRSGLRAGGVA
ncbi:bifunctional DNA primase/polymerase [Stackebrandtia nassauensis]|uniref:Bifunctional DNA primase/polymerase n=1 Tax=Stackebrandtia nassauensis (strain DSM 44728 / CIP 108903 / NRRL B-16338 / NBRC 102104 / LLR-40K-21) TaxID=446470 RepID=D3Q2C8_STANL|nr:bifunctional DNA primase/polymerase [Stackebrandtia nassauensis]ADD43861.1 Bifunctional DNA primase/polymerase [Stackebrandtia nassauensis DSM 44728]